MNIASYIPLYDPKDKAEVFLCSILKENIKLNGNYVQYLYPFQDTPYALGINIFNEHRLNESQYNEFVDMLLEDLNEVELYISIRNINGQYNLIESKNMYPQLGSRAQEFLSNKDNSKDDMYYYNLDSVQYVLEYLSLIYKERPELLERS